MRCPYCKYEDTKVIDSRASNEGAVIRRRRHCEKCERRCTTYERMEQIPLQVIKKDLRRESYDRSKVLNGIIKACEKRPVPAASQESIVNQLEKMIDEREDKEVSSSELGAFVMTKLSELDQVAYVRFASVYREFTDVSHFMEELKTLLRK